MRFSISQVQEKTKESWQTGIVPYLEIQGSSAIAQGLTMLGGVAALYPFRNIIADFYRKRAGSDVSKMILSNVKKQTEAIRILAPFIGAGILGMGAGALAKYLAYKRLGIEKPGLFMLFGLDNPATGPAIIGATIKAQKQMEKEASEDTVKERLKETYSRIKRGLGFEAFTNVLQGIGAGAIGPIISDIVMSRISKPTAKQKRILELQPGAITEEMLTSPEQVKQRLAQAGVYKSKYISKARPTVPLYTPAGLKAVELMPEAHRRLIRHWMSKTGFKRLLIVPALEEWVGRATAASAAAIPEGFPYKAIVPSSLVGNPEILAHELGHLTPPKGILAVTQKLYRTPILGFLTPALAAIAATVEDKKKKAALLAGSALAAAPTLIEEARASIIGTKMLKELGIKPSRRFTLPVAFSTYLLFGAALPMLVGYYGTKLLQQKQGEMKAKQKSELVKDWLLYGSPVGTAMGIGLMLPLRKHLRTLAMFMPTGFLRKALVEAQQKLTTGKLLGIAGGALAVPVAASLYELWKKKRKQNS